LKGQNLLRHFREIGTWVNWNRTVDQSLHGDPEAEVRGIATAWIPTNEALKTAAERGPNLFINAGAGFLSLL